MKQEIDASVVIERLGGTTAVAAIFGIKPPSVSEWKEKGEIPSARLMYLRLAYPNAFATTEECDVSALRHEQKSCDAVTPSAS